MCCIDLQIRELSLVGEQMEKLHIDMTHFLAVIPAQVGIQFSYKIQNGFPSARV